MRLHTTFLGYSEVNLQFTSTCNPSSTAKPPAYRTVHRVAVHRATVHLLVADGDMCPRSMHAACQQSSWRADLSRARCATV